MKEGTILDNIIARPVCAESIPDSPTGRLTTGQVVVAISTMGECLANAADAYGKLPNSRPDTLPELLNIIITQCEGAITKAKRLKAANQ